MGLVFGNTGDRVDHGSAAGLDDISAGTLCWWFRPTTSVAEGRIVEKGTANRIEWRPDIPASSLLFFNIARATLSLRVTATDASLPVYATQKWMFAALVWNIAGVDGDQRFYLGDRVTLAAEPSSYGFQRVGSGARTSDAASNFTAFGNTGGGTEPFHGAAAWMGLWNRQLTVGEIHAQQFRRLPTSGSVLFAEYGYAGTGTQPDWSGRGNAGTVTGATVTDHVPLAFRRSRGLYTPYTAAAAAAQRFNYGLLLGVN